MLAEPSIRVPSSAPTAPRRAARRRRGAGRLSAGPAAAGLLAPALALAIAGCTPAPGPGPATGTTGVAAGDWPFVPEEVRIHPLTRLVEPADGPTYVEARIELLDFRGDGTKGIGLIELGLFDERGATGTRRSIDTWRRDLGDLDENAAGFDPVTRTYLYRLLVPLGVEVFELEPVLYVRYDAADGRSFVDRMELRIAP